MPLCFSDVVRLTKDAIPNRRVHTEWQGHPITLTYKPGMITPAKLDELRKLSVRGNEVSFNAEYLKVCLYDWDVLLDNGDPYPLPAHAGEFGAKVNEIREKLITDGKTGTPLQILAELPDDPEEEGTGDDDEETKEELKQKKATKKQEKLAKIKQAIEHYSAIDRLPPMFLEAMVAAIIEDMRPKGKRGGSFSDS